MLLYKLTNKQTNTKPNKNPTKAKRNQPNNKQKQKNPTNQPTKEKLLIARFFGSSVIFLRGGSRSQIFPLKAFRGPVLQCYLIDLQLSSRILTPEIIGG